MPTLTYTSDLPVSAEALFDWHDREGALYRLLPPWAPVRVERFEGIGNGDRAELRIGPGPLAVRWVAEHHDRIEGRQFCDRQVEGPFAHWEHMHRFEPTDTGGSTLVDRIEYVPPGGPVGDLLAPSVLEPELSRQFAYRHRVTRRDLELHRRYNPDGKSLTVAVSGSSGLVGTQLCAFLATGGHHVKRLVRSGPTGPDEILWNARTNTIEAKKLEGIDAVVHLAGENVFGFWTEAKKKRIYQSRADGTALLADALAGLDDPPDVFVSASAVGYYGDHGIDVITEDSSPQRAGFLSDVCNAWESSTRPAAEAGIRTVSTRIGVVLTPAGGALQLMLPAFWLGLGGRVGASDQYFPWITLDDVIGGLYHALWTDALHGPVNLTAPNPVTMQAYTDTLARILRRPALLNVPTPVVRTLGGEMAEEMLLKSARAVPERLQETGYPFAFSTLAAGLRHLLGRSLATRTAPMAASSAA
jgi:uncharacterized protein (TIGR01777 family)